MLPEHRIGISDCVQSRRNLSYKDLAERLQAIGVKDTEKNIVNKIVRGGFTAAFFLQCMAAIGVNTLHLNDAL